MTFKRHWRSSEMSRFDGADCDFLYTFRSYHGPIVYRFPHIVILKFMYTTPVQGWPSRNFAKKCLVMNFEVQPIFRVLNVLFARWRCAKRWCVSATRYFAANRRWSRGFASWRYSPCRQRLPGKSLSMATRTLFRLSWQRSLSSLIATWLSGSIDKAAG